MHGIESRFDHQKYCLQACMCALFSPEMLQAGAVKGLINTFDFKPLVTETTLLCFIVMHFYEW